MKKSGTVLIVGIATDLCGDNIMSFLSNSLLAQLRRLYPLAFLFKTSVL